MRDIEGNVIGEGSDTISKSYISNVAGSIFATGWLAMAQSTIKHAQSVYSRGESSFFNVTIENVNWIYVGGTNSMEYSTIVSNGGHRQSHKITVYINGTINNQYYSGYTINCNHRNDLCYISCPLNGFCNYMELEGNGTCFIRYGHDSNGM